MEDIARLARVATSTVSRVMSGGKPAQLISKGTATKVRRIALQLRYVPNFGAKMLRSRESPFVAVIGGHFTDTFSNKLRNAIDVHLRQHDLVPLHIPYDADEGRAMKSLRLAQSAGARRFIILSSMPKWSPSVLEEVRLVMVAGVAVGFGPKPAGFSTVEIDQQHAAASAVEHLVSLSHRKICVLDGPPVYAEFRERSRAWRMAARRLGVRMQALPNEQGEIQACQARWKPFFGRCTAVIACDDSSAFKLLQVAQFSGFRVPSRLSIVGFDDVEIATDCLPTLTTVSQPVDEMAEHAIRLIQSETPARVILKTALVQRGSTSVASR